MQSLSRAGPRTCATTSAVPTCGHRDRRRDGSYDQFECKQCYNEVRLKQGGRKVTIVEQKTFRGKLWAALGVEQFVLEMW